MDELHRAINDALSVRIVAAICTQSAREAARRQDAQASEALILARAIGAGCLLATLAKGEKERVRIHLRGSGPIKGVIADAHGDGRVRACLEHPLRSAEHPAAQPTREQAAKLHAQTVSKPTSEPASKADPGLNAETDPAKPPPVAPAISPSQRWSVQAAVGASGSISVVRDLGLKQPYEGTCALVSGQVDEDIEHYLNTSEQLPSLLICDALLDAAGRIIQAGGVLCQAFPGADPEVLHKYKERLAGDTLYQFLRQPRSAEDLLNLASGMDKIDIMGKPRPLRFECSCGPKRARSVLATLGADELRKLAQERETVDVTCNFCHQAITLSSAQVVEIADELARSRS